MPSTTRSASCGDLRGPVRLTPRPTQTAPFQRPLGLAARAAAGRRRGRWCRRRRTERALSPRAGERGGHRGALVHACRWAGSRAPCAPSAGTRPASVRRLRRPAPARRGQRPRRERRASGRPRSRPCPRARRRPLAAPVVEVLGRERPHAVAERLRCAGSIAGSSAPGLQPLEPVVADVGERVERRPSAAPPGRAAARHARDEPVPVAKLLQHPPRGRRHGRRPRGARRSARACRRCRTGSPIAAAARAAGARSRSAVAVRGAASCRL